MLRVLPLLFLVCACGRPQYGGANCNALRTGTPAADLPITGMSAPPDVFFMWSDPLIEGTEELRCCANNVSDGKPPAARCAAVDCAALQMTLTLGALGNEYVNEDCGNGGVSKCTAVLAGGELVGVSAFCFD